MIGCADLVAADPGVFTALAGRWAALADGVARHREDLLAGVGGAVADGSWLGPAGDAARQHVERVAERLRWQESDLRRVSATLEQSALNFAAAQAQVSRIARQAGRLGLVISPNGGVSVDPTRSPTNLAGRPVSLAAAELIGNELNIALRSADEADHRAARAIRSLTPPHPARPPAPVTLSTVDSSVRPEPPRLARPA
jgi:hypothetical protein